LWQCAENRVFLSLAGERKVAAKLTDREWLTVYAHAMQKPQHLLPLQRQMRKNPTEAEAILWEALRGKKLGVRFLRQKAIGRYIVDFYCASAKLVIELDGSVHDSADAQAYDALRQHELEARGLQVVRFANHEITHNLHRTLERLHVVSS
jgi:very-short-patch-repair endonuclease